MTNPEIPASDETGQQLLSLIQKAALIRSEVERARHPRFKRAFRELVQEHGITPGGVESLAPAQLADIGKTMLTSYFEAQRAHDNLGETEDNQLAGIMKLRDFVAEHQGKRIRVTSHVTDSHDTGIFFCKSHGELNAAGEYVDTAIGELSEYGAWCLPEFNVIKNPLIGSMYWIRPLDRVTQEPQVAIAFKS